MNLTLHFVSNIAPGGETIKQMQADTGCKINVSQASGADIEREIGLVGTRQAIDDAKRAIWDKVDQVVSDSLLLILRLANSMKKEKNAGRRGGGGGGGARDNGNFNDSYSQQQPSYGQPAAQPGAAAQPAQGDTAAVDPYAAYGGYQNYLNLWYSSIGYQAQQQPGQQGPPGA